jgi:integrase
MDTERTQATVNPEAWAEAQVEAVAQGLEKKAKRARKAPARTRGVFFRWGPGGEVVGPKHVCAERVCDQPKCGLDGETRGEWWVLWYDSEGRRHREKAGTKAAAIDLHRRRKTEVRQGKHFPESMRQRQDAILRAICDEYIAALKANRRDSRGQVKTRLAEVCEVLGPRSAASVTVQDVERLKARLLATPARGRKDANDAGKEKPRSPASVNRFLQDLRAAYNLARKNGKVEKNPVADVKLLRENNKRIREITDAEEKALVETLDPARRRGGTDLRPMVRLLLETGLRLGEACAMRWAEVDWTGGFLTLPETKAGEKQHVPLSAQALAILRALCPGEGYVFAWPDGRPWTVDFVNHAFSKAVRKAGITDLHAHDCRHTFACRKLRAGVDLYTVSKLLRHASIAMTERYTHLSRGDLKAAVNKSTAISTATGREAAS